MDQHTPQRRLHAFNDDALGELDAVGVAAEIEAGRISATEAVEAAIGRIELVNPDLNGLACEDFDRARLQAARGQTGFFGGVPSMIKDNVAVAGLPTQQGTSSYTAHREKVDGDFAQMFRGQGLINLGKSQLSEFGFNASAEFADRPPVRNPWHTGHTSGASSAGAGAFVASGALPIAHANDGGGSIRIPAACNGLVGLKPTRGRVPQDKMMREMPVRIIADGVVTRSVRDTAAFLRESEKIHRNLKLPPIGDITGPGTKRLKIAMIINSVGGLVTDPETADAVRGTAKMLESLGHHVEEIDAPVPEFFIEDFLNYWSVLAGFMTTTGKRTLDPSFDKRKVDNLTKGLARRALKNAHRLPLAIARLAGSGRISRRFFRDYDVAICPTLGQLTPELGWLDPAQPYDVVIDRLMQWCTFTPLQNATGDPAISLPMGMSSLGLPIGVQVAASQGHEARLLEVAYELEEAAPFARIQDG